MAQAYAEEIGALYLETSAKDDVNVQVTGGIKVVSLFPYAPTDLYLHVTTQPPYPGHLRAAQQ